MKIIFSGGGTAGHINPALAIADYVRIHDPSAKILYVGSKGGMEEQLVANARLKFEGINVSGFRRNLSLQSIKHNTITVKKIFTALHESKKILKSFQPDICVGTGGYVSGPILNAAHAMKIPIIIHEQNAFPGVTTKILSKKAKWVMLAVSDAQKYIKKSENIVITGNPVRKEIINTNKAYAKKVLHLDDRPVILSFGGSLGAKSINKAVADLIAYCAKTDKFQHIHAYGKFGQWFKSLVTQKGVNLSEHKNLRIHEYINNMPICLAAADLVICRAGAITISELQAQGKASILIPSPNVAENHQYYNAMTLVKNHAASIIEEKDLTGQTLIKTIKYMLADKAKLEQYSNRAKEMAILDATQRIYAIIKETCMSNTTKHS